MNSIAIIPARGGSVRVPRKNIKLLCGKPLIYYTIRGALESGVFKDVFVSTEDKEIGTVALIAGASIIHRPLELAEDVESELVIQHAINEVEKRYPVDIVTMLQPTSPLRTAETIQKCVNQNWDEIDSCITVHDIEGFRPEWMCSVNKDGMIFPYTDTWEDEEGNPFIKLVARQDLPKLYKQNGCVYTFKKELIMERNQCIGSHCKAIIIEEEEAFDVDTPLDFLICEVIMERRNG